MNSPVIPPRKKRSKNSKNELRDLIREMHETHPPRIVAAIAGRLVKYVHHVASEMGVRSGGCGKDFADLWAAREEAELAETWGQMTVAETALHFGRTRKAIMQKAYTLNLGRVRSKLWRPDEDAALRAEYPAGDVTELSRKLGRSAHSIRHRVSRLGVKRGQNGI